MRTGTLARCSSSVRTCRIHYFDVSTGFAKGIPTYEAFRTSLAARPRERRLAASGWTTTGNPWIAVRLPQAVFNLTSGIPSTLAPRVAGKRHEARAEDGSVAGTVTVSEVGPSWGYVPFLSRYGAAEGHILVAEFDLVDGKVFPRLEPADMLAEPTPFEA